MQQLKKQPFGQKKWLKLYIRFEHNYCTIHLARKILNCPPFWKCYCWCTSTHRRGGPKMYGCNRGGVWKYDCIQNIWMGLQYNVQCFQHTAIVHFSCNVFKAANDGNWCYNGNIQLVLKSTFTVKHTSGLIFKSFLFKIVFLGSFQFFNVLNGLFSQLSILLSSLDFPITKRCRSAIWIRPVWNFNQRTIFITTFS